MTAETTSSVNGRLRGLVLTYVRDSSTNSYDHNEQQSSNHALLNDSSSIRQQNSNDTQENQPSFTKIVVPALKTRNYDLHPTQTSNFRAIYS